MRIEGVTRQDVRQALRKGHHVWIITKRHADAPGELAALMRGETEPVRIIRAAGNLRATYPSGGVLRVKSREQIETGAARGFRGSLVVLDDWADLGRTVEDAVTALVAKSGRVAIMID